MKNKKKNSTIWHNRIGREFSSKPVGKLALVLCFLLGDGGEGIFLQGCGAQCSSAPVSRNNSLRGVTVPSNSVMMVREILKSLRLA